MADDPGYRYSVNQTVSDGSQTLFEISFAGGYINRDHVKVRVFRPDGSFYDPAWSWVGDYQILLADPAPAGNSVRRYRQTPADSPIVDFADAAIINEATLDINARQAVFLAQEAIDAALTPIDRDSVAAAAALVGQLPRIEQTGYSLPLNKQRRGQVNLMPATDGSFPNSGSDELDWMMTGGNPTGSLPNVMPTDTGKVIFLPPTEEGTNFVAPSTPWEQIPDSENPSGSFYRIIPMDIRTVLFNTPVSLPLFKPVRTNGWGTTIFRYIGEKPLFTTLEGSIDYLVRCTGATTLGEMDAPDATTREILQLVALNPPTIELGQNGGNRHLGTAIAALEEAKKMRNVVEFQDLCHPITQNALDGVATQPELYTSSQNVLIESGSTLSVLTNIDPSTGLPVPTARTTTWIDISAYDPMERVFLMVPNGTSTRCRIQCRDAGGNITYWFNQSMNRSSRRMINLPAGTTHFRVYYAGIGDTSTSISIKPVNRASSPEYCWNLGYWQKKSINVQRDVVFYPNTDYLFNLFISAYGGANVRDWGFRYLSGGLNCTFDAGRMRKTLAKRAYRSIV